MSTSPIQILLDELRTWVDELTLTEQVIAAILPNGKPHQFEQRCGIIRRSCQSSLHGQPKKIKGSIEPILVTSLRMLWRSTIVTVATSCSE
jgi:hypothetical protein